MSKLNPTEKTYTEPKLSNACLALTPVLVVLYFVQGVSIVFHWQEKKKERKNKRSSISNKLYVLEKILDFNSAKAF